MKKGTAKDFLRQAKRFAAKTADKWGYVAVAPVDALSLYRERSSIAIWVPWCVVDDATRSLQRAGHEVAWFWKGAVSGNYSQWRVIS